MNGWGQATSSNFSPFNLLVMKTVENWRNQHLSSPWPRMVEFHDLVGVAIAAVSNKLESLKSTISVEKCTL